jgi:hypothetical protein
MTGATFPVFLGVTVILMGGAGWLMGQALARGWRPVWQVVGYGLLLGFADRFLTFSLFDGALLAPLGYVIDTAVIVAFALIGYRTTLAAKMVAQYPWLYRRAGPFRWRPRGG